jgi:hypothetical protein
VIAAALAAATTPDELDAVMRAMVAVGTRCTYLEACYHVPPVLRARVSRFFDADGQLHDPDAGSPNPFVMEGPFASLAAVVHVFHRQLAAIHANRPAVVTVSVFPAGIEASQPVGAADFPSDALTEGDHGFVCPICDKRVDAEPMSFRGSSMCAQCVSKLRGF